MRVISKRRMATTTMGVILAVAIIFSMFTLGNNFSRLSLYESLEESPYQIAVTANINPSNYEKLLDSIKNVKHVEGVTGYISTIVEANTENYTGQMVIGYWPNANNTLVLKEGRLPKSDYEIAVDYGFAMGENLSVGSVVNCTAPGGSGVKNVSFRIVGMFTSFNRDYYVDSYTTLSTMKKVFPSTMAFFWVKIDAEYLLESSSVSEINKKLSEIQNEIYYVVSQYSSSSNVNTNFQYSADMMSMIGALVISLPIIVMGSYLSKVAIEIELTERRREFGVLKIRGATGFQRFKLLFYESVIYSLIGGVVGYLLGEFVAYAMNISIFQIPFFTLDWGWSYVIASIITSFFLFFMALYKPWKKINTTPILELITHYSQRFKEVEYSATRDMVLSSIFWGYIIIVLYLAHSFSYQQGFNLIMILAIIGIGIFGFLFPVILIVLPLSMARLLTLGTQKFYQIMANGISKLTGTSGALAKKGMSRNPKNIAYIAFILAFILTYSSFMSSMNDNQGMMNDIQHVMFVGGDFRVDLEQGNDPVNLEVIKEISNSKNQSAHCWLSVNYDSLLFNEASEVIYVNFENYTKSVYHLDYFIEKGSLRNDRVAITEYLANRYSLKPGDPIYVTITTHNYSGMSHTSTKKYIVGAVMYSIPGLPDDDTILINKNVNVKNATSLILKAKNYEALKKELNEKNVRYEERKSGGENYAHYFILTAEAFMILLGSATIFIIQYSLYFNRRGEISLYKVRGARRKQVTAILMVEGVTIIILSSIIGLSVGLALSYTWVTMEETMMRMPPFFTFGYNFAVVTSVMILMFLLSQYIISFMFSRVKESEVLRSLGGEM